MMAKSKALQVRPLSVDTINAMRVLAAEYGWTTAEVIERAIPALDPAREV